MIRCTQAIKLRYRWRIRRNRPRRVGLPTGAQFLSQVESVRFVGRARWIARWLRCVLRGWRLRLSRPHDHREGLACADVTTVDAVGGF